MSIHTVLRERSGRFADGIDEGIHWMGRACAWLTLLLVLLVAGDVLARYIWHVGSVAEQQLEWHLLAVVAMLSAPFTLQQDEHVRVDIFYQGFSERAQPLDQHPGVFSDRHTELGCSSPMCR